MLGGNIEVFFPALWEAKSGSSDREEIRDKDAVAKLIGKQYADKHRRAKDSEIKVGDRVVVAVQKKIKTDPSFSDERYTVLSREGGKLIVRSEHGVQYARKIQDVKLVPDEIEEEKAEESRLTDNSKEAGYDEEMGKILYQTM